MKVVPAQPAPDCFQVSRLDAAAIATCLIDFGEGPVLMGPACRMVTGSVLLGTDEHASVSLVAANAKRIGLTQLLTTSEARRFGRSLIELADRIERLAADQADAALRKAAGK